MKLIKQKLTKNQIKNRDECFDEISTILKKYPYNTPVFIIRGQHVDLEGGTLNLKEITHWEISGCEFTNSPTKLAKEINKLK